MGGFGGAVALWIGSKCFGMLGLRIFFEVVIETGSDGWERWLGGISLVGFALFGKDEGG